MDSHSFPEEDWQLDLDLSSRGRHLLKTGLWADVEFAFAKNENVIKAHRLTLASASPVFKTMLYGSSAEEKSPIRISDVTMETFNLLLEYIYTDNIEEITVEKVPEIEDVSKKYLVPGLKRACAKTLTKNVTPENALQCHKFGTSVEYQPLMDACTKVFKSYTIPVLESENALTASIDTLEFMFSGDFLTVDSELNLLRFVEKYAKAMEDKKIEADTQKKCIRRLLQKIRFLSLDMSELAKHHQRLRAFLTENEILSLMINYNCTGVAPMPEGFTTDKHRKKEVEPYVKELSIDLEFVMEVYVEVNDDAERFSISFSENRLIYDGWRDNGEGDMTNDIAFHMSVRFVDAEDGSEDHVVIRNSFHQPEGWGQEEREEEMPFERGDAVMIRIGIDSTGFRVCANCEQFCSFNHRLEFKSIKYMQIKGDVSVSSFKVVRAL